jgi:23S rRNA pseudouridine955/2504/2580 synthase
MRKGEVRVNKSRVKPDYKLQKGDVLRIPPIRATQVEPGEFLIPGWVQAAIEQPVFEDEALVVINKPAGLAVHGGSGIEFGLIEGKGRWKRLIWQF